MVLSVRSIGKGAIIRAGMDRFSLTSEQQLAVETTGRSVAVSAAAGSGKTAVLAQRCAYLVCDAPEQTRCNADELLVLTFTESAAAEMRARIVESIRAHWTDSRDRARLREQLAMVDAAQLSTIHSFCLWLVRRWFGEIGVDPLAAVLDAEEAELLKRETIHDLFEKLYDTAPENETLHEHPDVAASGSPAKPSAGGSPSSESWRKDRPTGHGRDVVTSAYGRKAEDPSFCAAFAKLVDDYGLGNDRDINLLIRKLFDFTNSLPDPDSWLDEAVASVTSHPTRVVAALSSEIRTELDWQIEHCEQAAAEVAALGDAAAFHAEQIRQYLTKLRRWAAMLSTPKVSDQSDQPSEPGKPEHGFNPDHDLHPVTGSSHDPLLDALECVRAEMADYSFSPARAPRLSKNAEPSLREARDAASAVLKDIKKRLFTERLKTRFALFSVSEWIDGLLRTAPYIETMVGVVRLFREAYTQRKRRVNVLDFSDLERYAFQLLQPQRLASEPSDVSRALHERFAYVLVDEFQDINPLQLEIIRLASRETDPVRADNLFTVGDVKQSIYRFRLAEPAIFTQRIQNFRQGKDSGLAIALQKNFRSRPAIIDTVNFVFRRLMRQGVAHLVYDQDAELRPGRLPEDAQPHLPVELHLLERAWTVTDEEDAPVEPGVADQNDPARWTPVEREGFLIAARIRDLMQSKQIQPGGEALRYGHIAILLRAAKINAERIAAMLASLGIPAYANAGGSLFNALEVQDTMAALHVLDNPQQDIPLAAVLRSGVFGERLSEDDLVEIRCLDREIPFHACVRRYLADGLQDALRDRLHTIWLRIQRYRRDVRGRPLADVLWRLGEEHGYLACAGALPNGLQRRANLFKLYELARRFGTFRRQGLYRFLRFVESLEEDQRELASAPAIGESEDVVRIMSIHQSKGLEFPVVFLAGLGTRFNLGDRSGRMIFERGAGIGLRVVDTNRMIEYPSAAHRRVALEVERTTREEELRILYVALTRARDKIVLVGTARHIPQLWNKKARAAARSDPSPLSIATASTPLDWLVPIFAAAPATAVASPDQPRCDQAFVEVTLHEPAEMAVWSITGQDEGCEEATRRVVARGDPLPASEPLTESDVEVERIMARLDEVYPALASAVTQAAVAASAFQGAYDFTRSADRSSQAFDDGMADPSSRWSSSQQPRHDAAQRGIINHRALQHLDFYKATNAETLGMELHRMVSTGIIAETDRMLIDKAALTWFVSTPLAKTIRQAGKAYRREFSYIATESPAFFDRSIIAPPDDKVLVRGIVDGILPVNDGIEIIDFKTDAIGPEQVEQRTRRYQPQMTLYARAMANLWRRPVRACWLVFLTAREVRRVADLTP